MRYIVLHRDAYDQGRNSLNLQVNSFAESLLIHNHCIYIYIYISPHAHVGLWFCFLNLKTTFTVAPLRTAGSFESSVGFSSLCTVCLNFYEISFLMLYDFFLYYELFILLFFNFYYFTRLILT